MSEANKMDEIETIIMEIYKDLIAEENKKEIVKKLNKIGAEILKSKIIFDGHEIQPLWIEAYYWKNDVFEDDFCYQHALQKGNGDQPFRIFFHPRGNQGGADLVIGTSDDIYCSFLIKRSVIEKKYTDQPGLCNLSNEQKYSAKPVSLEKLSTGISPKRVTCKRVIRKDVKGQFSKNPNLRNLGDSKINESKECYRNLDLAVFLRFDDFDYDGEDICTIETKNYKRIFSGKDKN